MTIYYLPTLGGFMDDALTGPRMVFVPNPEDPEGPYILAPNTACTLPPDAFPVSDEEYQALLERQHQYAERIVFTPPDQLTTEP